MAPVSIGTGSHGIQYPISYFLKFPLCVLSLAIKKTLIQSILNVKYGKILRNLSHGGVEHK